MIRLRPYKSCDAKNIVSWCNDEETFLMWGGERFGNFPVSEDIINRKYFDNNGDCSEEDNFYPITALEDNRAVGHFIMRYTNGNSRIIRFGWVIVDSSKRGKGYGKKMLSLGLKLAFEILMAENVTIGVFEKNISAFNCYRAVGFREAKENRYSFAEIKGTKTKIIELEIAKEDYFDIHNQ